DNNGDSIALVALCSLVRGLRQAEERVFHGRTVVLERPIEKVGDEEISDWMTISRIEARPLLYRHQGFGRFSSRIQRDCQPRVADCRRTERHNSFYLSGLCPRAITVAKVKIVNSQPGVGPEVIGITCQVSLES